jgi:branched-chain amino acid transport system substrate-binding protein
VGSFVQAYIDRYKQQPDRIAALGYDAGMLACTSVAQAGGNAQQVAEALCAVKKYQGASGLISFDKENRSNTEVMILKIKDTTFVPLQ